MKILMTGASGFMGKAWLDGHARDHDVITIGRTPTNHAHVSDHIVCDLSQPGALASLVGAGRLPEKADAIIHLAVSRLHRTFPETASDLFEVNVAGSAALLDYGQKAKIDRFVLGSSGSVYDGCDDGALVETRPLTPRRFFPVSKLAGELLASEYRNYFKVATLRYFTPYGPGQTGRLIPDLIQRVAEGRAITIPEIGGGISLTTLFLDDCVRIANLALEEGWNETVNAASPEIVTIEQLGEKIGQVIGKAPIFERKGGAPAYQLTPDLNRLGQLLDMASLTSLLQGLSLTVQGNAPNS
jgi:UDP-glucose 4-epimerase